jgi:hypothetical protein
VVIVGCAGVAPSSAAAIDPLVPGSHDVRTIEYSAGSLRLDLPGTSSLGPMTLQQPLEGSITYPAGAGPWKVLLFLHGNHQMCIKADVTAARWVWCRGARSNGGRVSSGTTGRRRRLDSQRRCEGCPGRLSPAQPC